MIDSDRPETLKLATWGFYGNIMKNAELERNRKKGDGA